MVVRECFYSIPMTCYICETIERDLNDVVRTLRRRTAAQVAAPPSTTGDLDLEIRGVVRYKGGDRGEAFETSKVVLRIELSRALLRVAQFLNWSLLGLAH
jgi:hypothetical protein